MAKRKQGRAVIYARISDDRDGQGAGVERQRQACRELATAEGLTVIAELEDNSRSASSYSRRPRPAWRELLEMLERREVDYVLAWATDRLYRQVLDLEHLIPLLDDAAAEVLTVSSGRFDLSSPEGRLYARMTAAVAAHESERKSARIRAKELEKARDGRPSGGGARAYGYAPDGLTIVEAEAAVIRDCIERVLAGETLTSIAKRLNADGVPTASGGRWRIGRLKSVLTGWRIAGVREHHGSLYPGVWTPIVERATLERVRARLLDPERTTTVASPRVAPLRGLAYCGLCGERLVTGSATTRGRPKRRTYRCGRPPAHTGCGRVSVSAEPVEAEVFSRVAASLEGSGLSEALSRVSGAASGVDSASVELVAARQRLDELSSEYWTHQRMPKGEYLRRRGELEGRVAELERQSKSPASTRHLSALPSDADDIVAALRAMPAATAYSLLGLIIARITVDAGRPGAFDPQRVRIEWKA